MPSPVISTRWRGGHRIIIDLEARIPAGTKFPGRLRTERDQPGYTLFRVFAADPYETAPLGKRGRAYNGPRIAKRVEVPHTTDDKPDVCAIREMIAALHRRWPSLWFHDRTHLNLHTLFPPEQEPADHWLPPGSDNLDDI